jgi:Phage related hypothetical protein (DUF1799)
MQTWGFEVDELIPSEVVCWPENRQSVEFFLAMGTQWRIGMSGRTGLDYAVLPEMWRRMKVGPDRRDRVFFDLQVLEAAALSAQHQTE